MYHKYTENDKELALLKKGGAIGIRLTPLSNIKAESVSWLWNNVFARGVLNSIQGVPGSGKSYAACAIAAAVSDGGVLPVVSNAETESVRFQQVERGRVIYFSGDDTASTVKTRLEAIGGNCENVLCV